MKALKLLAKIAVGLGYTLGAGLTFAGLHGAGAYVLVGVAGLAYIGYITTSLWAEKAAAELDDVLRMRG